MLLMAAAMLILPSIDAIAKFLSESVGAGQVTWSRFFFQTLFMLPLALRIRQRTALSSLWIHAARGILLAAATVLFFIALKSLPIADAISIFFVEPLLLTILSAIFLREQVGWRRASAVVVGLLGSALVIQPNFATVGATALLPLGTAACFAVYLLLTRKYSVNDDPATMQFYAGVFGCGTMTVVVFIGSEFKWDGMEATMPGAFEWVLLVALGLIATVGHLMVVSAFKLLDASILAPFQYLEIVSATLLGFLFFNDFPDSMTWLGIMLIISSGLYVFHRERVRRS